MLFIQKDVMLSFPITFTSVIGVFAPVFSRPVWQHVTVLLTGTILVPGKRTVTAILHGPWRSVYLQGAFELCNGIPQTGGLTSTSLNPIKAVPPDMTFDYFAVRLHGRKPPARRSPSTWTSPISSSPMPLHLSPT
jgi:hypothetical protein